MKPRLAFALALLAAATATAIAGCGGETKTVTETRTQTNRAPVTTAPASPPSVPAGNHGPHYFQTPSRNIGCFISRHDARCDIRNRSWSPPAKPAFCKRAGLDYGQGLAVGPHRAEFVCAGDTALGGPAILPYRSSAQRGTILCVSRVAGITCRNTANGHGFFLSRASYRIF